MVWVTNFQIVRMRIITKFTLLYLILLFITLIAGGFVTYQIVKQEVKNETDYSLIEETRIIVESIEEGKPIFALENVMLARHLCWLCASPKITALCLQKIELDTNSLRI